MQFSQEDQALVGYLMAIQEPLHTEEVIVKIDFYRTRVRSLGILVSNSLTQSLTNCRLVNLIDVTLACEDDNSKLVGVVTVADVDDEKRFDDSFMQFWKLKFGHKAKFCSDFEHKVWPRV